MTSEVEFTATREGLAVRYLDEQGRLHPFRVIALTGQSLRDLVFGALHVVARGGPLA